MRSRYEWVEASIAFRPILSFLYIAFFVGLPRLTSASRFGDEIWGKGQTGVPPEIIFRKEKVNLFTFARCHVC